MDPKILRTKYQQKSTKMSDNFEELIDVRVVEEGDMEPKEAIARAESLLVG